MRDAQRTGWGMFGVLLALVVAAVPVATREAALERGVLILSPSSDDQRLGPTREAIAFWNRTFADLALASRLEERAVLIESPATRVLENFARRIWQQAGRLRPGIAGPPAPPELTGLPGDVVVLLSRQELMSFAWPITDASPRYFVAISADRETPPHYPMTLRNVIAHELGHTLGLVHNGHSTTLMCGPCRTPEPRGRNGRFLPLIEADLTRLRRLYE